MATETGEQRRAPSTCKTIRSQEENVRLAIWTFDGPEKGLIHVMLGSNTGDDLRCHACMDIHMGPMTAGWKLNERDSDRLWGDAQYLCCRNPGTMQCRGTGRLHTPVDAQACIAMASVFRAHEDQIK